MSKRSQLARPQNQFDHGAEWAFDVVLGWLDDATVQSWTRVQILNTLHNELEREPSQFATLRGEQLYGMGND